MAGVCEDTVVIEQLDYTDQVFQLAVVNAGPNDLEIVFSTRDSVLFCELKREVSLQIVDKFSFDESEVVRIESVTLQKENGVAVLTSANKLYYIRLTFNGAKLLEPQVVQNDLRSDLIELENPIMAIGEKYIIIHTTSNELNILQLNSISETARGVFGHYINTSDVLDIKFVDDSIFEIVSRNAEFHYNLTVYQISENDRVNVLVRYNPFKQVPRHLCILPETNCSLVICDDIHLIYPYPNTTISKSSTDSSIKFTRVSVFKNLEKEIDVVSVQVIDANRVMILLNSGDFYVEHIMIDDNKLTSWKLFPLGKLIPLSRLLHLNQNLFMTYSKESQNCFFRINAESPYLDILKYFRLHDFFIDTSSPLTNLTSESSPIQDLQVLHFIHTESVIKVQSSLYNSSISLKMPLARWSKRSFLNLKCESEPQVWFEQDCVIMRCDNYIKVLELTHDSFRVVSKIPFTEKVKYCHTVGGKLYIVTAAQVHHQNRIIFDYNSIVLAVCAKNDLVVVTNDDNVHFVETLDRYHEPGIVCIAGDLSTLAMGFKNGTVKIDKDEVLELKISSSLIIDLVVKENYVLALDSQFRLFRIIEDMAIPFMKSSESFRIQDVPGTDKFFIKNAQHLSINFFDESYHLVTSLLKISDVPEYVGIIEDDVVYCRGSKLFAIELWDLRLQEKKFLLDDMILRSCVVQCSGIFPVLVLLTRRGDVNCIKLLDLVSFQILDVYEMESNESLQDIVRANVDLKVNEQSENSEMTEQILSLIKMELFNSGFVTVSWKTEDNSSYNALKLFSIGEDMKINFHYRLEVKDKIVANIRCFKLSTMGDNILSVGADVCFFDVSLNEKFGKDESQISDNVNIKNFEDQSVLKLNTVFAKTNTDGFFATDVRILEQHKSCFVCLSILQGLNFFEYIDRGKGNMHLRKFTVSGTDLLKHKSLTLIEIIDKELLIVSDTLGNVYLIKYYFRRMDKEVNLNILSCFNMRTSQINVIKNIKKYDAHLCLIGTTSGEVFSLELYPKVPLRTVQQLQDRASQIRSSQNTVLDTDTPVEFNKYRLARDEVIDELANETNRGFIVDLRNLTSERDRKLIDASLRQYKVNVYD